MVGVWGPDFFFQYGLHVLLVLLIKSSHFWGTWVAHSVEHLTSAQVMISGFVGSSSVSGSALTAQSLEPASDSVSSSLSAPPPLTLCLCLSKINKNVKKMFFKLKNFKN